MSAYSGAFTRRSCLIYRELVGSRGFSSRAVPVGHRNTGPNVMPSPGEGGTDKALRRITEPEHIAPAFEGRFPRGDRKDGAYDQRHLMAERYDRLDIQRVPASVAPRRNSSRS